MLRNSYRFTKTRTSSKSQVTDHKKSGITVYWCRSFLDLFSIHVNYDRMDKESTKRATFLKPHKLYSIKTRINYGLTPLETHLSRIPTPQPSKFSPPRHRLDPIASQMGMSGYEVEALRIAAESNMLENETLMKAYKDFIMIAKLYLNDHIEEAREKAKRVHAEEAKQERNYLEKTHLAAMKAEKIRKDWTAIRRSVHSSWTSMMTSLRVLVEMNPHLSSMSETDVKALQYLSRSTANVVIKDGEVVRFDFDTLKSWPIEEIKKVTDDLSELLTPEM